MIINKLSKKINEIIGNNHLSWTRQSLIHKCFEISGLDGDYLEFGTYTGNSLVQAYWSAYDICQSFKNGDWDCAQGANEKEGKNRKLGEKFWGQTRFIGFDSFEGIPSIKQIDSYYPIFKQGSYKTTEEELYSNLKKNKVDIDKVKIIKGFFSETLNLETVKKLNLQKISVIYIDSDLYESALQALEFCTPFLCDGTSIIFDEWYQFKGNPNLGEQRAFKEWCDNHPEWIITKYQLEGAFKQSFILSKKLEI